MTDKEDVVREAENLPDAGRPAMGVTRVTAGGGTLPGEGHLFVLCVASSCHKYLLHCLFC